MAQDMQDNGTTLGSGKYWGGSLGNTRAECSDYPTGNIISFLDIPLLYEQRLPATVRTGGT